MARRGAVNVTALDSSDSFRHAVEEGDKSLLGAFAGACLRDARPCALAAA
jgi:hypothetical protein